MKHLLASRALPLLLVSLTLGCTGGSGGGGGASTAAPVTSTAPTGSGGSTSPPPPAPPPPPNLTVDDLADRLEVRSGQVLLTLWKSPLRADLAPLQSGSRPLVAGDPRGALTYMVDQDQRLGRSSLGSLANARTYQVTDVVSWTRTAPEALALHCATDEQVAGVPVTLSLAVSFETDRVLKLVAELSQAQGLLELGHRWRLPLDEQFAGLGEWWDSVRRRGRISAMQPEPVVQVPFYVEEIHFPVPFLLSSRGYGLHVEERHRGHFDLGATSAQEGRFSFKTSRLAWTWMAEPDPRASLERYVARTGRPVLPPEWAFAPHQWRNVVHGEADLYDDTAAMRAHDIPGSVVWIDGPWEAAYNTFQPNQTQFPDFARLIGDLRARGYRTLLWISEHMNFSDDSREMAGMAPNTGGLFEHGRDHGYFMRTGAGGWAPAPWWKGTGAIIDFQNPPARAWWQDLARPLHRLGISGWKVDGGETIEPVGMASLPVFPGVGIAYHSIHGPVTEMGPWRLGYHEAFRELIDQELAGDGVLISRAGCPGDQVNASVVWPGDLWNDFSPWQQGHIGGLPAAVVAGITVGTSGFPHFAPDIGGFKGGTPTKNALIRWAEFGALCSVMQLGGGGNHNPWDFGTFDQQTLEIYRRYARLHTDLFPYLYSYAHEATRRGMPVMRGLYLDFPGEPQAWAEDHEYLLGDWLLVAPVVEDRLERQVWLPPGRWIDWWSGAVHQGPQTLRVSAPLDTIPLFARAGAIVPLLAADVDTLVRDPVQAGIVRAIDRADQLRVLVWPEGSTRFQVHDGTLLEVSEVSGGLDIAISGAPQARSYELTLHPVAGAIAPRNVVGDVAGALPAQPSPQALAAARQGWYRDAATGLVTVKLVTSGERVALR